MQHQIAQGTLSAPSWRLIRNAKLAAHIYAPLGTEMALGDYVRVVRTFLEAFKVAEEEKNRAARVGTGNGSTSASEGEVEGIVAAREVDEKIVCLSADLKVRSIPFSAVYNVLMGLVYSLIKITFPPMESKTTAFAVHSPARLFCIASSSV